MQPVLCTNLYGQKVWVSQTSAGAFRRHGGFDVPTLALIEYLASCFPQAVAFDIGANIGNHTVVLGKFCKQVVAFEPRLAIEEYLRENVVQNGLTNCELVAAGLSDSEGTAKLFLSASAEGGTSTFVRELSDAAGGDVEVPIQIGDHFGAWTLFDQYQLRCRKGADVFDARPQRRDQFD